MEGIVVGAVLLEPARHPGRLLCAQRAYPALWRGFWEFPGGKVEVGEEPQAALAREILEELSVQVQVKARLPGTYKAIGGAELVLYVAHILPDVEPRLGKDHLELRWISAEKLGEIRWLPSNESALDNVKSVLWA